MAAVPTYMHEIRSIKDAHPNLPAVLRDVDLNRRIQANTPIDPAALAHAQAVAKIMRGFKEIGVEPLVTDAVVQSAELHARAVEAAHTTAEFAPVNLVQALQDLANGVNELRAMAHNTQEELRNTRDGLREELRNTRDGLRDELHAMAHNNQNGFDELRAMVHNSQIITRNVLRAPEPYVALRKTIIGHGLALARAVANSTNAHIALVAPNPIPALNTAPPDFDDNLPSYSHHDILRMIIFYNNNFGITVADNLPSRIDRFRKFLTGA